MNLDNWKKNICYHRNGEIPPKNRCYFQNKLRLRFQFVKTTSNNRLNVVARDAIQKVHVDK